MPALLLLLTFTRLSLVAQTPSPLGSATATITADDLIRHVSVLAADSMQGRATPSPGLEQSAAYVASEFRRAGLKPVGEAGSYLQRFEVTRWIVDTARSVVELKGSSRRGVARLGTDARYIFGKIPERSLTGPVVVIAGPDTATTSGMDVKGKMVLLVADFSKPVSPALNQKIVNLARAGPKAVLVLSNRDSATFALRLVTAARPRLERDSEAGSDSSAPVIELHEHSVGAVLAGAGIEPGHLRALHRGEYRLIPGIKIEVHLARRVLARAQVPNVVGMLEGSDSVLRQEYLVYSAHFDHIGTSPGQPDSINNGADDNAAGVGGLLELAEAFTQPGVRPRRSILFLAPSAEEDGLLGSEHFTEHPTVPLSQLVANLNMDLIGRNWRDSVIVVGLEQSDLGKTLQLVVQAHPELSMSPIADRWPEERIFYRSDHYSFARKGVPILFFTSGTHADYHQPSDETDRIDGEKAARLVRLLFYLGMQVADTQPRPRWAAESYRQIVERK
jgi:hypothetical protein